MEAAGDLVVLFLFVFHMAELKISEIILKDHKLSYPPNPSKKKLHYRIDYLQWA